MPDRYASLKQGLVGAWIPSVSGSGLLLPDLSGRGNHGTLTNMGPEDWVSGQYGRALDFDGSDDYVISSIDSRLDVSISRGFTGVAWVYPRTVAGGDTFAADNPRTVFQNIQVDDSNSINYILRSLGGKINLTYRNAANTGFVTQQTNSAVITTLSWQHIAAVHTGTSILLYRNGILADSTLISGSASEDSVLASSRLFRIGRFGLAALPRVWDGQIDDVRVYNRALSPAEIRLLATRRGIAFERRKRRPPYIPRTSSLRRKILTGQV